MKLKVPILGQRDPMWSNHSLGTTPGATIGKDGCLLVCNVMLAQYNDHLIDPVIFDDWCISRNGYDNGDFLYFSTLSRIYSDISFIQDIKCVTTLAPLDKIYNSIKAGYPVIIGVNFNNKVNEDPDHYVLVTGIMDDGTYIINDPWYDDEVFLPARYNLGSQAETILEIILYQGKVTNFVDVPVTPIPPVEPKIETPPASTTLPEPSKTAENQPTSVPSQPKTLQQLIAQVLLLIYHYLIGF